MTGMQVSSDTAGSARDTSGRDGRPPVDIPALAALLHETAEHHGSFEAVALPHDWWDWYAAYLHPRQIGSTPEESSAAAGRYMAEMKHVVVSPVVERRAE